MLCIYLLNDLNNKLDISLFFNILENDPPI